MDPLTVDQMVTAVVTEGGFDSTASDQDATTVLGWMNAARSEAISRAKWRKTRLELGPTVADQAQYALPAGVVDLQSVRVDGSRQWMRVGSDDYDELASGYGRVDGAPGAFAPDFEADGDPVLALWPTPTTAGLSITGLAVVLPSSMEAGHTETVIPADLQRAIIVHGAVAEGKLLVEEDQQAYELHRGRWDEGVKELTRRGHSRIGRGATQIRLG